MSRLNEKSSLELAIRASKVNYFRLRRLLRWGVEPTAYPRPRLGNAEEFAHVVARVTIPLSRCDAGADPVLEAGKRWNVALAAPHFDGLLISPDQPLSFWRTLGRPTRERGFRHGMELRGGCIVPTLGGGLCLISNALFKIACELGWNILERHGHTLDATPPSGALWGLDATVFWPHVDLRIAPAKSPVHLSVKCRADNLVIEVRAAETVTHRVELLETARNDNGMIRENIIERVIVDAAGERREIVAENKKKLVAVAQQRRNCLTCAELSCKARPKDLPRIG